MAAMLRAPFRVAALSHCKDLLTITWQDGKQSNFPNIWLRSAVRDPIIFNAGSLIYKRDEYIDFIRKEPPLVCAQHEKGSEDILVEWGDHFGTFNASWLRAQDQNINKDLCKEPDITLWDANSKFPIYEYSERKETFRTWFNDLRKYGLAIFKGVPPNENGLMGIMHSIGQEAQRVHPTNVQHILHDSKIEQGFSYAYSSGAHPMHVDTPYYGTMHRLTALLGKRYNAPVKDTYNFLVDNLKVIEDMRQDEPEAYELLRTIPVSLSRRRLTVPEKCKNPEDHYLYQLDLVEHKPMIDYDTREKQEYINMTNKQAGVNFRFIKDQATMKRYYDAYRLLQKKLDDEAYKQRLLLKEGTAILMNNGRVSHGRDAIHQTTSREILLALLSEGMWNSRWRILKGQQSGLEEKWLYACPHQTLDILAERMDK